MPTVHQTAQNLESRILMGCTPWIRCRGGIANQRGQVAGLTHFQRQVGMPPVHRYRVLHHPVVHHVKPREQGGPTGSTGSRLRKMLAKG